MPTRKKTLPQIFYTPMTAQGAAAQAAQAAQLAQGPAPVPSLQGALNLPQIMQPAGGAPPPQQPPPEEDPGVDPEVLSALVDRGLLDDETAQALLSGKRGAGLAETPMPQGTQVPGPFGGYVAPNPLEYAAAGLARYKGYKKQNEMDRQLEAIRRRKYADDSAVMRWYLE